MQRLDQPQTCADRTETHDGIGCNDLVSSKVLAATALNHGLDTVMKLAQYLPDGKPIGPGNFIENARKALDVLPHNELFDSLRKSVDDSDAINFLEGFKSIRRDGTK